MAEKRVNFSATANVGLSININKYEQVRSRNAIILKDLQQQEGNDVKLPTWAYYYPVLKDQVINFGEDLILSEAGNPVQFPFEVFDELSALKIELPCKMRGNVEKGFNELLDKMSPEVQEELLRKKPIETARFHHVPLLTKVKLK